MPPSKVVFISCGKRKLPNKARAEDLYCGSYFNTCLELAKNISHRVYILSAKHGLLKLDDVIEPYELTLNKFKKKDLEVWRKMVLKDIKKIKGDYVFLCGKNYSLGLKGEYPLDGFGGMGHKLKEAKRLLSSFKKDKRKKLF